MRMPRFLRRLLHQLNDTYQEILKTGQRLWSVFHLIALGAHEKSHQLRILLPLLAFFVAGLYFFPGVYTPGHIVHSDMDFGFEKEYLFRIFPLWNFEWSTANFFNLTRIAILLPIAFLGWILDFSGSFWGKSVVFTLLYLSSLSMYTLLINLFREDRKLGRLKCPSVFLFFASVIGGLFYAYNPYVVFRIQHIYLLVGYSLLPFVFLLAIRLTEDFTKVSKAPKTYDHQKKSIGSWFQKCSKIRKEQRTNLTTHDRILSSLIGFSIIWAIGVGAVHYLFFTFFLVAFWGLYRLTRYILQRRYKETLQVTARLTLGGLGTMLLIAYYLAPYIAASRLGSIAPPNINSIDSLDMVSRNNLPHLVLYLISYWWGLLDFASLPLSFWLGGGVLFSTMALAILFRIHNKFVLFITGFCVWSYTMSFGTKWMPDMFLWFVFKGPLAGPIGFIFRDGNKFVGLLAFGMAILLGYGIISLFELLSRLREEQSKAREKKKGFKPFNYFTLLMILGMALFTTSLHYYFQPVHKLYFSHFYYPTPIPKDYHKTRTFLDENHDGGLERTLTLPRYETIVTPGNAYCIATWNARKTESADIPPRATSSHDIWSLSQRTYHPQEGATVFWHTMHDYLFEMLGEGKSHNLGRLIGRLAIDRIAFHNDILGFDQWLKNISQNLIKQDQIEAFKDGKIGFFEIFKVKSVPWAHVYTRNLMSFSGLSILDPLLHWPEFQEPSTAFFFATQNSQSANLEKLNPGDILQATEKDDVILSQIDKKYFLHPFQATLYGNPFYRWAKLRTDTPDWSWQLKNLGIPSQKRAFDFGKGIAYTFVPRRLDIEPYQDLREKGTPYNFAAYLKKDEPLLISDIPEVLTIQEGFSNTYDRLPSSFGKTTAGSGPFWRVAKTKKFPAKPENGYFFELTMSGRNTQKVHAKVKFYDAGGEEVGVAYVSAPREVETFAFIKFKGLYVTPPETESFQVEILSFQNPELKSTWTLHQFDVLDLEPSIAPNTLTFDYQASHDDIYDIYLRAFENKKGGRLAFRINQKDEKIIATHHKFHNQFKWYALGSVSLKKGESYNLEFENLEGVNALNLVAVVPQEHRHNIIKDFDQKMQDFHQMVLLESDIDFEILGHRQPQTHNPNLSNGQAVQLGNGFIRNHFEILKEADYQLRLRLKTFEAHLKRSDKFLKIYIQEKESGKTIYQEKVDIFRKFARIKWLDLPALHLKEGAYQIRIEFKDSTASLLTVEDFREWREDEFFFTLTPQEKIAQDCSPYVRNTAQPLTLFLEESQIKGSIESSASCDWVSSVSNAIEVDEKAHHFLSFEIAVKNNHKLHFKVLYFDRDRNIIKNQVLFLPTQSSYPSFRVEEILQTPPEARFMQLQLLTRPHPEAKTQFVIKDFILKNFEGFPLLDLVALYEKPLPKTPAPVIENVKQSGLGYRITLPPTRDQSTQRYTLQLGESFTPLWTIKDQDMIIQANTSNILLNAYPVTFEGKPKTIQYALRVSKAFYIGVTISIITFIILLTMLFKAIRARFHSS